MIERLCRFGRRHRRRGAHADRPVRRIASQRPPGGARRGRRRAPRSSAPASRPALVDEVLIGHGRQAGSGPNPARQVGIGAGLPDTVPAQTINKACASGMQAIVDAARSRSCSAKRTVVLAGGIESMSRMPYLIDAEDARWGHRMGNFTLVDAMYRDGFTCSLCGMIMGETAEVLARQYGITREASDAYALESAAARRRARSPTGRFRDEIAPVTVTDAKGQPRRRRGGRASARRHDDRALREAAAGLPEVEGQPGIITAGTSSGITDGGAAVVLDERGARRGARLHAARAHHRLGERRRRSADHGHRSGAGDAQAARADRA